jgi:hypothetical protein
MRDVVLQIMGTRPDEVWSPSALHPLLLARGITGSGGSASRRGLARSGLHPVMALDHAGEPGVIVYDRREA